MTPKAIKSRKKAKKPHSAKSTLVATTRNVTAAELAKATFNCAVDIHKRLEFVSENTSLQNRLTAMRLRLDDQAKLIAQQSAEISALKGSQGIGTWQDWPRAKQHPLAYALLKDVGIPQPQPAPKPDFQFATYEGFEPVADKVP